MKMQLNHNKEDKHKLTYNCFTNCTDWKLTLNLITNKTNLSIVIFPFILVC